tara:strand:+ start:3632 stop:3823 length:192 start_codon:yes stop_codon:yes gene_type:complete
MTDPLTFDLSLAVETVVVLNDSDPDRSFKLQPIKENDKTVWTIEIYGPDGEFITTIKRNPDAS